MAHFLNYRSPFIIFVQLKNCNQRIVNSKKISQIKYVWKKINRHTSLKKEHKLWIKKLKQISDKMRKMGKIIKNCVIFYAKT
jgi:flagellar motor component MotA